MATTNVGRFLQGRYDEAISKYDTDQHSKALDELKELPMDDQLSSVLRCLANAALADGVGVRNWFLAESYRSYAEEAYDDLASFSIGLNPEEQKAELACFREMLDSLAAEQQRNDLRQLDSVSDHHSDAVSKSPCPESSIWLTGQPVPKSALQEPLELPVIGPPSVPSDTAAVAHTPASSTEDSGTLSRVQTSAGTDQFVEAPSLPSG